MMFLIFCFPRLHVLISYVLIKKRVEDILRRVTTKLRCKNQMISNRDTPCIYQFKGVFAREGCLIYYPPWCDNCGGLKNLLGFSGFRKFENEMKEVTKTKYSYGIPVPIEHTIIWGYTLRFSLGNWGLTLTKGGWGGSDISVNLR